MVAAVGASALTLGAFGIVLGAPGTASAGGSTTVWVTQSGESGWSSSQVCYTATYKGVVPTLPSDTVSFVDGPGAAPDSVGSVRLATGNGTTGGTCSSALRNSAYQDVPLADLTTLSYWTNSTVSNGNQFPFIELEVNFGEGGTTADDTLFFEPPYQTPGSGSSACPDQGTAVKTTWQKWTALAGCWWTNEGLLVATGQTPTAGGGQTLVAPLSKFLALYPDAYIVNNSQAFVTGTTTIDIPSTPEGGVGAVVGEGTASTRFVGNVGELTVGTTSATTQYDFGAMPTLSSFSPAAGPTTGGTTVTIKGTNLVDITSVTFDGTTAASFTVTTATTTIAAVTKPHGQGTVAISVTNPAGTATSTTNFRFVPAPTVTSFSPTFGPPSGGTTVAIVGTNLSGATVVKFGTTTAQRFTITNSTHMKAVTKAHPQGAVTISVVTPGGTGTSSATFAFALPPTITHFTPTAGPSTGGTTVTITGTNLIGTSSVTFGLTTAATFRVTNQTQITATTKAHGAGTVKISLTNPAGSTTSTGSYTFVAAPTVTSFTPTAGPTGGGTTVTITGTGFSGTGFTTTSVTFGTTTAATFRVTSPTTITAKTTGHPAATVHVSVTTPGGTATSVGDYTFVGAPTVTSFAPTAGPTGGGTTVTITGTGFIGTGFTTTSVTFGTTTATTFTVTSSTTITATTKGHPAATVHVSVSTPGGTATSVGDFTFVGAPTVTSFTPTAGPTGGGTTVTITGSGFSGTGFTTTSVKFGTTTAATFRVTNPTTVTAKTKGHPAATVHVAVATAGGTGTSGGNYTFVGAPTVTSFTPTAGPTGGGTTVTIKGTGFSGTGFTTTSVTFGTTTAATFRVTNPTTITAKTKGHPAATVHVSVSTPGGTASSAGDYTFVGAPTVTSFAPTAGPTGGGTTVTITGTGFSGTGFTTTSVTFGSTTATSFTVTSPTTITAATEGHPAATVHVSVTTPGGTGTSSGNYTFVAAPTVTSFTPTAGPTGGGTTVTITGTGFSGTGFTATSVKFGTTTAATFRVTNPTTITAKTTGHPAATVRVSVATPGGTGTSVGDYTFVGAPTVTSFTPTAGPTGGGTTVTITGTGFSGTGFTTTSVTFGSTTATTFTVTSPTTITAKTNGHPAATVLVSVTTPGGTGTSSGDYTFVAAPTVTSFTPTAGPTGGGTTVTITGTGFSGTGFTTTSVKFGTTTAATFRVTNPTTITAKTNGHAAATVRVSVTTPGGTGTSSGNYTFVAAPTVTSFTPTAGPTGGGTTVTITGTGFSGTGFTTTSVTFGTTTAATFRVTNPTTITATTKGHPAATVHVSVTTPGGTGTSSGNYTFVAAPTVTSFTPTAGPTGGGTTVTITGAGFSGSGFTTTSVKFGTTTAASFHVTGPTTVTATTKGHAAAAVQVSVATPGGTATSVGDYTFVGAPTVTSFAPTAGPTHGGTTVTITGTGFCDVATCYATTSVKFGSTTAATFRVTNPTTITATTKGHEAATVHVSVTTPGGTGTSTGSFTFVASPTVTSFTPTAGPTGGGTTVTITGAGFSGSGFTTTSVKFGTTTAATFRVTNPTTITAKTKPHAAGTVHVSVTTPGGTGSSSGNYTFVAAPTVASFTPTHGPDTGGTTVTITGTGFSGTGFTTTSVKFGTTTAATFRVTNSTTITAKTKSHAIATVHISVTTPGGTATSSGIYAFKSPEPIPTITSLARASGAVFGGNRVTITGTSFVTVTAVKFGTTTATSFTVRSATLITATSPAHVAGQLRISVTTAAGTTPATNADLYTYVVPLPTVVSISPSNGPAAGGTTVTITGSDFKGPGFTTTSVKFGTKTGKTLTVNAAGTQITVKTPTGTAGTAVAVRVVTPGGESAAVPADLFTYGPSITSLSRPTGPHAGGTKVTITGKGFTNVVTGGVKFGGTAAKSYTVKSSTQITATSPAHAAGGVHVSVTTTAGTTATTSADAFTFT